MPNSYHSSYIMAAAGRPSSGLDVSSLERLTVQYFNRGLADSTHRTYSSAQNTHLKFCTDAVLPPLPASEFVIYYFVAYLANSNLKHRTIKGYLSALRLLHIAEDLSDPFESPTELLAIYTTRY